MNHDTVGKVITGVAWMTSARIAARTLGLVSTLVLARLLVPADFGLVAMAMAIASALELLTLFNFDTVLVRTKEITRNHYDSTWSLNLGLGIGMAVLLIAAALPAAAFYREPRLVVVMLLVALKYLIDSAANPATVDFQRTLNFQRDFYLQIAPRIAAISVALPLAIAFRDYRALLVGMLVGSITTCVMSYAMRPYRPRWCLAEARSMFQYSRWLLLSNLVAYLRFRSADLIIGRVLGPSALGVYTVANEISNLPSTELVAPINRVLFPAYVQLSDNAEQLRSGFRMTLGMIALIVLPVSVGVAALADPLVHMVLGTNWVDSIPLIALLALAGGSNVLQANTGSVHNALSHPRLVALTGALHAATLLPMIAVGILEYGLKGCGYAVCIHAIAIGPLITYTILLRNSPVRIGDITRTCWRPLVGCILMYSALAWLVETWDRGDGAVAALKQLVILSIAGGAFYLCVVHLLWFASGRPEGSESVLLTRARSMLLARSAADAPRS